MAEFEKGAQVRIVSGKGRGVTGEIFWWGKSKFDDGMRAGVAGEDGEKYWADEEDLELWDGEEVSEDQLPAVATGTHLTGLKIVLTGDFDSYDRKQAHLILERQGADVTSSVSGKTMVLIVGASPGSKVQKAQKRGIPQINESQMLAMMSGKTLDEVLGASATDAAEPAKAAEEQPTVEMPIAPIKPRNGTFETVHEGAEQIHVTGELAAGLRTGSWKMYWPNGQLKQDYEWQRGLKHGHELDWTEEGVQTCEGENVRHVRTGTWTYHHANGEFQQAYIYDENGKKHDTYKWNTEDGKPRARGQFWHGEKDGDWEWLQEPNHERMIRGFRRGRKHGEDAGWYRAEQLAYRRFYFDGYEDGDWETFHADGSPKFRGSYDRGVPVGDHHSWDEDGNETVTTYVNGLSDVPSDKALARLVKKVGKARDEYAKQDALDIVEYGERGALLYHLWKNDLYDVAADHELWELLPSSLFDGEQIVAFLKGATDKAYPAHLPYWSSTMDRLVMDVYARDPEPIEKAWESLPTKKRKGVALVRARFGKDIGDELHSEIGALAKKHAEDYGIQDRILWPARDGIIEERKLFADLRATPTELFDEFIGWFGGRQRWIEELMPYAMKEAKHSVSRVSFSLFRPIIETASTELMTTLCDGISLDNRTHELLWDALWEWREDDGKTMAKIAVAIEDDGLRKWPVVTAAVLKLAAEGNEIPDDLVDAFELDNESPTYSSEWMQLNELPEEFRTNPRYIAAYRDMSPGCAVPRNRRIHQALRVLEPDQLRRVFDRYLNAERAYDACKLAPYLYLVDDPEIWAKVLEAAEDYEYGTEPRIAWGFGNIGVRIVPMLLEAQKRATSKKAKNGWAQAIVCALCRAAVAGEEIPAEYDRHVRFDTYSKSDDHYYQYLRPFIDRLVYELPEERAEAILVRGLESSTFWRALSAVPAHPTVAVLTKTFTHLMEVESTVDYAQNQTLAQMLKALDNTRDWVKWILQSGGGGGCKDALTSALGWKDYEVLEKELASSGVEQPKKLDKIDRFAALAESTGSGETVYALRRLDEVGDTLNVLGGAAPGVGVDRWPMVDDDPMQHLYTLDLSTMPLLAQRYPGSRTLSVFCLQPGYNEAWEPYNGWTEVLCSTQEQVDADHDLPEGIDPTHEASFEVVGVDADLSNDDVRKAVYQLPARVMGEPIWLQDEAHWGDFVMQFDESFCYMNLGDSGVMYVYSDTAFWQCY